MIVKCCLTLDLYIETVYQTQVLLNQATRTRIKSQELPVKTRGTRQDIQDCRLIICTLGSRADNIEQRTRTTCQELQQADASEQRMMRKSKEGDGLLPMGNSIREPRQHRAKIYDYRAKTNDLKAKNKQPNNDVQRKYKMVLQKGAAVEETSKKCQG